MVLCQFISGQGEYDVVCEASACRGVHEFTEEIVKEKVYLHGQGVLHGDLKVNMGGGW
jgi:hypothetical protein